MINNFENISSKNDISEIIKKPTNILIIGDLTTYIPSIFFNETYMVFFNNQHKNTILKNPNYKHNDIHKYSLLEIDKFYSKISSQSKIFTNNPRISLIIIGLFPQDTIFKKIFMLHRKYSLNVIIITPGLQILPPSFRCCIDYICINPEPCYQFNRQLLFNQYGASFKNYNEMNKIINYSQINCKYLMFSVTFDYKPKIYLISNDIITYISDEKMKTTIEDIEKMSVENCPICITPIRYFKENLIYNKKQYLQSKLIIKTKCNHIFHTSCLTEWLETSNTCPICRKEL